jgi:hypothetical protein
MLGGSGKLPLFPVEVVGVTSNGFELLTPRKTNNIAAMPLFNNPFKLIVAGGDTVALA